MQSREPRIEPTRPSDLWRQGLVTQSHILITLTFGSKLCIIATVVAVTAYRKDCCLALLLADPDDAHQFSINLQNRVETCEDKKNILQNEKDNCLLFLLATVVMMAEQEITCKKCSSEGEGAHQGSG